MRQVRISYGVLTNPDLLLNYGFVLPNNVFETIGLQLELEPYAGLILIVQSMHSHQPPH